MSKLQKYKMKLLKKCLGWSEQLAGYWRSGMRSGDTEFFNFWNIVGSLSRACLGRQGSLSCTKCTILIVFHYILVLRVAVYSVYSQCTVYSSKCSTGQYTVHNTYYVLLYISVKEGQAVYPTQSDST